jgi:ribosomal protein S18 acetylase RimI-like enzyme
LEIRNVQWYQTELCHLTVLQSETRKGYAKELLVDAERFARADGARLLQCTIRESNNESQSLFKGFGYLQTSTFRNPVSGNNVAVFQKVLSDAG